MYYNNYRKYFLQASNLIFQMNMIITILIEQQVVMLDNKFQ